MARLAASIVLVAVVVMGALHSGGRLLQRLALLAVAFPQI